MSDQAKPTAEGAIDVLEGVVRHEAQVGLAHRVGPENAKAIMDSWFLAIAAIRAALAGYADMAGRLAKAEQERDAQVAEVAVLQVARDAAVDEFGIQKARAEKAEAALAEAGPLIEAVMETDILAYHDPDTDCPIITQALSYRAAMEAKGGKNG